MSVERMEMLALRAALYRWIRDFFERRAVLEVHTPVMSAAGNTEPNIEGFRTTFTGHVDAGLPTRYLRTSPEYPLKRLLAEGVGDCYELGPVFRNGEAGRRHNPEFHMLEWYRLGMDDRKLADEVVELVTGAMTLVANHRNRSGNTTPVRQAEAVVSVKVTTYRDLYLERFDLDPMTADIDALREPLLDFHINPDGLTHDDWLDLLFTHLLEPNFPRDRITVVHDWPATQCALARVRPGNPPVAERFELYLGSNELANGYHELNDGEEQRIRFERENHRRRSRGQPVLPVDENLLECLNNLPDCAGVALGIERLLMCLLETDSIADVMAFPFAQA